MLLRLKASELGEESASPQVQWVFKSPGKIGLTEIKENH